MAVEAIRYTRAPLQHEKDHVIDTAIYELIHAVSHQDEQSYIIQNYVQKHLNCIMQYENNSINFAEFLAKMQPLTKVPNQENNPNIAKLNTLITIINGLNNTTDHEIIFRQVCQNIQEIIHPEKMSLLQEYTYR